MSRKIPVDPSDQYGGQDGAAAPPDKEEARNLNQQGEALYLAGKPQEAVELFQKAVEKDPECVDAINNLGVFCWDNGNWDAAIQWLQRAVMLRPDDVDIITNLENVLKIITQQREMARDLPPTPGDEPETES